MKRFVQSLVFEMTARELEKIIGIEIKIEPENKCWFIREDWSHYTTIKGEIAHRYIYNLCVGPLTEGMLVCHKCDRPGCINPKHLFQGSSSDNFRDAMKKGRIPKFRPDGRRKLSWEEQQHINGIHWKNLNRFVGE